ncbi:MAG: DUF1189 family protein [Vulcanimicrobiota bacterium]
MQDHQTPGFFSTFIGSLFNFKSYPAFVNRSGGSMFLHFLLLVAICCGMYASISATWFRIHVGPYLDEIAEQVPAISVKDGKATVDLEQPYFYKIEGEIIAVIDTTESADKYLEEYDSIIVLSEDKFIVKESNGKVESYELTQDFALTTAEVQNWIEKGESWVFPGIFLLCFFWQVCWKAVQVLIVAAVVTLVQSSRPDFTTHWKLANLALVPAMLFGVVIYAVSSFSFTNIPGSGLVFWGILGGLTYYASEQIKKGPAHS